MWPFKKSKLRRRELHRPRPAQASLWWRAAGALNPWSVIAGLALASGATMIVLYGGEALPYAVGQTVTTKILAPYDFRRENKQRTQAAINDARLNTPSVYRFNEPLIKRIEGELTDAQRSAKTAENFQPFAAEAQKRGWPIDEPAYTALRSLTDEAATRTYEGWVKSLRRLLAEEPIVQTLGPAERDSPTTRALLVDGPKGTVELDAAQLVYVSDTDELTRRIERAVKWLNIPPLEEPLTALLLRYLQPAPQNNRFEPIWVFDKGQTDARLDQAEQAVGIRYDEYKKGDTLVTPGVIDEQEYVLLQDAWRAYSQALRTDPRLAQQRLFLQAGTAGLVALITLGLALYVGLYQPRIIKNPTRAGALAALLLLMLLLCRLLEMLGAVREWAILAVAVTGAILSIAYNQRFALGVTSLFCVLAAMSVSGGLALFVVLMTAAGITVLLLGEVRTRLKILEVGAAAALGAFLAAFCAGMMNGQELSYIALHAAWAALAGLVAAMLIQTLLPLIEKLFGIVTAMTLLEWCDVNKPLLKRLAQEAPGTYNHCLVLGSLTEAAAQQIAANGLLARVGSYYHDIGKINKPYYFVENYESRANRHEKLSPTMSLLIIVGHVKDGLELAREYGLPFVLHQFITEHHGTTVVRYFYQAASERHQAEGKTAVSETEFRYPGPKPRSKESAILMLCDATEGAVRALHEPTPGRIESTIHNIAMERLMDGQLDDCDMTLKELAQVEQSLVKSLCAIYHGRIAYPRPAAAQRSPRTA